MDVGGKMRAIEYVTCSRYRPCGTFVRRSVAGFRRPFRRSQLFSVTLIIVNAVILSNGDAYLQVTRL